MSEYDPFDEKSQQKRKKDQALQQQLAAKTENEDFRWLMGTARGRRIVWRQLERAGVYRLSFNTNAMQMAFAEGNRNDGLRTISMIHALCPEQYMKMIVENSKEIDTDDGSSHNDH